LGKNSENLFIFPLNFFPSILLRKSQPLLVVDHLLERKINHVIVEKRNIPPGALFKSEHLVVHYELLGCNWASFYDPTYPFAGWSLPMHNPYLFLKAFSSWQFRLVKE
jgi:hypothetical protein